jgi:hypothetical protein
LGYVMQRWNTAQKRQHQMLVDLANHGNRAEKVPSEWDIYAELQKLVKSQAKGRKPVSLPTPEKGSVYTPKEAYHILKAMNGRTRGAAMAQMIATKTVLCGRKQLYNLVQKEESELKGWWNQRGRPRVLASGDSSETSHARAAVQKVLQAEKAKKMEATAHLGISTRVVDGSSI